MEPDFLKLVDKYNEVHLKLIKFFQNDYKDEENIFIRNIPLTPIGNFLQVHREFDKDMNSVYKAAKDLISDGIVQESLFTMMTENGVKTKRTTPLGDKFWNWYETYRAEF